MSHHLDTPLASQNGQLYIDDLYVFPGDDSTVFVMDVNSNINGVHVQAGLPPRGALRVQGAPRRGRVRGPDLPGVLRRTGLRTGDRP